MHTWPWCTHHSTRTTHQGLWPCLYRSKPRDAGLCFGRVQRLSATSTTTSERLLLLWLLTLISVWARHCATTIDPYQITFTLMLHLSTFSCVSARMVDDGGRHFFHCVQLCDSRFTVRILAILAEEVLALLTLPNGRDQCAVLLTGSAQSDCKPFPIFISFFLLSWLMRSTACPKSKRPRSILRILLC